MSTNGNTDTLESITTPPSTSLELEKLPSIQRRIILRLLPLLVVLFAVSLFWLGDSLEEILYSANIAIARRSSMMTVYAVEASMVTTSAHEPWAQLAEKIGRVEGAEIEIINVSGDVLFSTAPKRRGITYSLGDKTCSTCHEDGSRHADVVTTFISRPDESTHRMFAAPLRNIGNCRSCHADMGPKLGMVLVEQPVGPIQKQIRDVQLGIAITGAIALLLTLLVTRWLLHRHLGRPLRTLVAGAREIGTGNLAHTIDLPERTELTLLANTLNSSVTRLASLQSELLERERLAAVGHTVAGLSHCLKNILNGLRGGQYIIDRAVEKNDTDKLRTGWQVMKNRVQHLERLTFDMLYFIKERTPDREPVDPNEVAREVIELLQDMASSRGVELKADLVEEVRRHELDRNSVFRALLNLVTNAIDACIESESGDLVVVRSRTAPDGIVLSVEDNGAGMSADTRGRLFTRFFSTKATRGTGLGLAVVKKIAEEHGGRLEVASEPGRGSTFSIHIPRASGEPRTP